MTDWNAVSAFMANVVPWPGSPTDPGYVNLHYSMPDRKDPTKLAKNFGKPFRSVDTFVARAAWHNNAASIKDQWFCLSLQKETKHNKFDAAKPHAHRTAANALAVKALWIDADVGTKDGEYKDIHAATMALVDFQQRHGLPPFSAMVGSGGGVHAYWISKTALTVKEWWPYAAGLRELMLQDKLVKDPGVTTDVARILRVPGTFNHKTTPPKPVQLFNLPSPPAMYDFDVDLAQLPSSAAMPQPSTGPAAAPLWADGVAPFKVDPAFAGLTPDASLQGGIDKHEGVLLDPTPIFQQCGFYQHALLTGGVDYDNALWHYSVLGSTFMEKGNEIAHSISKSHSGYTPDSTQAEYDRCVADRADRDIGYPSCAAIKGAGCKSCATCPLFAKRKSPLNIRPVVTATVNGLNMAAPADQTQAAKELHLPVGYDLNSEGIICFVVEKEVNGEAMAPVLLPLFHSKITAPWSQANPDCINFITSVDLGTEVQARIRHTEMNGIDLYRALSFQRVKIYSDNKQRLEQFFMSWLAKLHAAMAAQESLPFGWSIKNGVTEGFVYGSRNYKDDGSEPPCGMTDDELRAVWYPTGDIQHWFDACKLVTDRPRPDIWAIVALSFASPLFALSGQKAAALCAYGASAAGKSAAYSTGIAVWGNGTKGKQGTESTFNSVMRTMGELNNLPLYWDEIRAGKPQEHAYDALYSGSEGVEKARVASNITLRKRGTWATMMMLASNVSFSDYVMKRSPTHLGGAARVLEYFVDDMEPGAVSRTDAAAVFAKLDYSHGMMGKLYAKLLGMNHVAIKAEVLAEVNRFETSLKAEPYERLWCTMLGCIVVGARLANTLGAEFNVPRLEEFLVEVYMANRKKAADIISVAGKVESTEGIMTAFFARAMTNDQVLWTAGLPPTGPGKPAAVSVIHGPKDTKNTQVLEGVTVRWDTSARKLVILRDVLVKYLNETGASGTMLASLAKEYKMEYLQRHRLCRGTMFDAGRTTCVSFDIHPQHDWAHQMWMWSSEKPEGYDPDPPVKTGATPHTHFENFVQPTPVDTGFDTGFSGVKMDSATGTATNESVAAFVKGAKRA